MAFDIFKKKKEDLDEAKEEVLSDLPELPPLEAPPTPDVEEFKKGFRDLSQVSKREELPPPPMPVVPPPHPLERISPEFREVKPVQPSIPSPQPAPIFEEKPKEKKHIFIRIDKYKKLLETLSDLSEQINATKEDLEDINALGEKEAQKLREAAEVVLKIEDLITKLQKNFSGPEE